MADKRIFDLNSLPTIDQDPTDIYEVSANGAGSFKETRQQMASYIVPLTGKGELLTHDATNVAVLAVGGDGTVLSADASTPTGLNWISTLVDGSLVNSVNWFARQTFDSAGNLSINYSNRRTYDSGGSIAMDWNGHLLYDLFGVLSHNFSLRTLYDPSGTQASINYSTRRLIDSTNNLSHNYNDRQLFADNGTTAVIDYSDPNFIIFSSQNGTELIVGPGAAPIVNYFQLNGAPTGNTPILNSVGGDTDVGMTFQTQGNGNFSFSSAITGMLGLRNDSAPVNAWNMWTSNTGAPVYLEAVGGDTNIDMQLAPKGTGKLFTTSPFQATGLNYPVVDGAAGSVVTTDGAGNLSLQPNTTGGFMPFTDVPVAGPTQMVVGNGYIATSGAGRVQLILPIAPVEGDYFIVHGYGGAGWQINIGTAAMLRIGNQAAVANIQSSDQWDSITFRCVAAASGGQWKAESVIGNMTIN